MPYDTICDICQAWRLLATSLRKQLDDIISQAEALGDDAEAVLEYLRDARKSALEGELEWRKKRTISKGYVTNACDKMKSARKYMPRTKAWKSVRETIGKMIAEANGGDKTIRDIKARQNKKTEGAAE